MIFLKQKVPSEDKVGLSIQLQYIGFTEAIPRSSCTSNSVHVTYILAASALIVCICTWLVFKDRFSLLTWSVLV